MKLTYLAAVYTVITLAQGAPVAFKEDSDNHDRNEGLALPESILQSVYDSIVSIFEPAAEGEPEAPETPGDHWKKIGKGKKKHWKKIGKDKKKKFKPVPPSDDDESDFEASDNESDFEGPSPPPPPPPGKHGKHGKHGKPCPSSGKHGKSNPPSSLPDSQPNASGTPGDHWKKIGKDKKKHWKKIGKDKKKKFKPAPPSEGEEESSETFAEDNIEDQIEIQIEGSALL